MRDWGCLRLRTWWTGGEKEGKKGFVLTSEATTCLIGTIEILQTISNDFRHFVVSLPSSGFSNSRWLKAGCWMRMRHSLRCRTLSTLVFYVHWQTWDTLDLHLCNPRPFLLRLKDGTSWGEPEREVERRQRTASLLRKKS